MTDIDTSNPILINLCFKTSIFQHDIEDKVISFNVLEEQLDPEINTDPGKLIPEKLVSYIGELVYDLEGLSNCDYQDNSGWFVLRVDKYSPEDSDELGYLYEINILIEFADELEEALKIWHGDKLSEEEIEEYVNQVQENMLSVDDVMEELGHSLSNGAYYN